MSMKSEYRIQMSELYKRLGFSGGKIPKNFSARTLEQVPMDLFGTKEEMILIVKKSQGGCKHRVFVCCPLCGKEIQAGRLNQHVDTKKCNKC